MLQFLRKMFDTSAKDVQTITPLVDKINAFEERTATLSDDELRAKTDEFKRRLAEGETLDQVLPEAFAVVREASVRTLGMRHFDVQMLGGIVLHTGRISEMKTGEGKTLVAVAPMYLNALTGSGSHLVTVNDYLARRDAVWMGPIYHFLGMSIGIIQGQSQDSDELGGSYRYEPGAMHDDPRYVNLVPCSRREAYLCDITYGTNHEFGFDYLRDNMAFEKEQLVMRELSFAIIDEVDSILIDEARTPHIISGPANDDVSVYKSVDEVVKQLVGGTTDQVDQPGIHFVSDKKNHSASLTEEGMDLVEEIMGLDNIAKDPKLFHHLNAAVKAYGLFQKDIDYVVRSGEVVIVDENTGRMMFGRRYSDGLHQALEAKENVQIQRESQTVAVITFQNLFRLYEKLGGMTGTAKTEEDEFRKIYGLEVVSIPTHRPMIRVDQDDIVYKTQEAKFRGIGREILRLFTKQQPVLVGTRSIEMSETVSSRLTADMLQRLFLVDLLFDTKENQKGASKEAKQEATDVFNLALADIKKQTLSAVLAKFDKKGDPFAPENLQWFLDKHGLPAESKEYLEEALKHGIPHNVLNAKLHEKEALIVAEAGRKGAVTIATNMAGRGVDILLGGRVSDDIIEQARKQDADDLGTHEEYDSTYMSFRRGGKERAAPPLPLDDQERTALAKEVRALGGLYILGTERHESRRIDNQLRGRAGRQGDPGESRFFVSLEDQLWKIFNAKMLENPLLKAWPPMEEVKAGFLSKMILKTQERIENHFFEARKHVLEYDDVLNSQRETIYGWRREILLGRDCREDLLRGVDEVVHESVGKAWTFDEQDNRVFDYEMLFNELNEIFPLVDYASIAELEAHDPGDALVEFCQDIAHQAYQKKADDLGDEIMSFLEQRVMLQSINDRWMDHLQTVEYIREGIGLRGYGQVDPLIAYKRETFDLFQATQRNIRDQSVRMIFRAQVQVEGGGAPAPAPQMARMDDAELAEFEGIGASAGVVESSPGTMTMVAPSQTGVWPAGTDPKRIGRNDPCPCGSGKKFKACHYPEFRANGEI
ncbi:MAG TPA: SEC-C metal-binding domain-containing protein [Fimbriimonadaceae bacterium]|nr:SEC-C metal-binding domain-containing protein [Fimbriimonadaceae bacterium]